MAEKVYQLKDGYKHYYQGRKMLPGDIMVMEEESFKRANLDDRFNKVSESGEVGSVKVEDISGTVASGGRRVPSSASATESETVDSRMQQGNLMQQEGENVIVSGTPVKVGDWQPPEGETITTGPVDWSFLSAQSATEASKFLLAMDSKDEVTAALEAEKKGANRATVIAAGERRLRQLGAGR